MKLASAEAKVRPGSTDLRIKPLFSPSFTAVRRSDDVFNEGLAVCYLMFASLLHWRVPPHFWNVCKHDIQPEETSVSRAEVASSVQRKVLARLFKRGMCWESS